MRVQNKHWILGIQGPMHSGKTTLAKAMREWYNFEIFSFGDAVKYLSSQMLRHFIRELGVTYDITKIVNVDRIPKSELRPLYQWVATEFGRDIVDQELWIKILKKRIDAEKDRAISEQRYARIVIDDVRFDNERTFIEKQGGQVLHLIRPEEDRLKSVREVEANSNLLHGSEVLYVPSNSNSAIVKRKQTLVYQLPPIILNDIFRIKTLDETTDTKGGLRLKFEEI